MGLLDHPNLVRMLESGRPSGAPTSPWSSSWRGPEAADGGPRGAEAAHPRGRRRLHLHRDAPGAGLLPPAAHAQRPAAGAGARGREPVQHLLLGRRGREAGRLRGGEGRARRTSGPQDGVAAGKLHYLSPEQTLGESAHARLGPVLPGHRAARAGGGHPPVPPRRDGRRGGDGGHPRGQAEPAGHGGPGAGAASSARRSTPDLDSRYRTAGEFAGALLAWALDSGNSPSRREREVLAAEDPELRRL